MVGPIYNPEVPFTTDITEHFGPGTKVRIQGRVPLCSTYFFINFQAGDGSIARDVPFQFNPRFNDKVAVRRAKIGGKWGKEDKLSSIKGHFPFSHGQPFAIIITVDTKRFQISVGGKPFASFHHRTSPNSITHLSIQGEVSLSLIQFSVPESETNPPAPKSGQLRSPSGAIKNTGNSTQHTVDTNTRPMICPGVAKCVTSDVTAPPQNSSTQINHLTPATAHQPINYENKSCAPVIGSSNNDGLPDPNEPFASCDNESRLNTQDRNPCLPPLPSSEYHSVPFQGSRANPPQNNCTNPNQGNRSYPSQDNHSYPPQANEAYPPQEIRSCPPQDNCERPPPDSRVHPPNQGVHSDSRISRCIQPQGARLQQTEKAIPGVPTYEVRHNEHAQQILQPERKQHYQEIRQTHQDRQLINLPPESRPSKLPQERKSCNPPQTSKTYQPDQENRPTETPVEIKSYHPPQEFKLREPPQEMASYQPAQESKPHHPPSERRSRPLSEVRPHHPPPESKISHLPAEKNHPPPENKLHHPRPKSMPQRPPPENILQHTESKHQHTIPESRPYQPQTESKPCHSSEIMHLQPPSQSGAHPPPESRPRHLPETRPQPPVERVSHLPPPGNRPNHRTSESKPGHLPPESRSHHPLAESRPYHAPPESRPQHPPPESRPQRPPPDSRSHHLPPDGRTHHPPTESRPHNPPPDSRPHLPPSDSRPQYPSPDSRPHHPYPESWPQMPPQQILQHHSLQENSHPHNNRLSHSQPSQERKSDLVPQEARTQPQQRKFCNPLEQPRPLPSQDRTNSHKAPQDGRSYQPPLDGKSYLTPEDERSYQPPQYDRSYQPPQYDRSYQPPQYDRSYQPPQYDRSYQPPQDGRNFRPAQDGRSYQPPHESRSHQPYQGETHQRHLETRPPKPPQSIRPQSSPNDTSSHRHNSSTKHFVQQNESCQTTSTTKNNVMYPKGVQASPENQQNPRNGSIFSPITSPTGIPLPTKNNITSPSTVGDQGKRGSSLLKPKYLEIQPNQLHQDSGGISKRRAKKLKQMQKNQQQPEQENFIIPTDDSSTPVQNNTKTIQTVPEEILQPKESTELESNEIVLVEFGKILTSVQALEEPAKTTKIIEMNSEEDQIEALPQLSQEVLILSEHAQTTKSKNLKRPRISDEDPDLQVVITYQSNIQESITNEGFSAFCSSLDALIRISIRMERKAYRILSSTLTKAGRIHVNCLDHDTVAWVIKTSSTISWDSPLETKIFKGWLSTDIPSIPTVTYKTFKVWVPGVKPNLTEFFEVLQGLNEGLSTSSWRCFDSINRKLPVTTLSEGLDLILGIDLDSVNFLQASKFSLFYGSNPIVFQEVTPRRSRNSTT